MSQVGKLLPNLNITLDDNESKIEDIDEECLESSETQDSSLKQDVKISSLWMEGFQKPKIYMNTDGGFSTGLDLMSEDNTKVREKRAERFGFETGAASETIFELYKSMDISVENKNSAKFKSVRLDAVHMRGVEEMSTKDIFDYFKDYGPGGIEWINDYSCNVIWLDEPTAARALLGLSKHFETKQTSVKNDQPGLVSSSSKTAVELDSKDRKVITEGDKKEPEVQEEITHSESSQLDIPVPPGNWRLGIQHPKAKAILLRFATIEDKKKPGSEKRSNYYRKYGNPNYGGLKGLISSSWKRKIQAGNNRRAIKSESDDSSSEISLTKSLLTDDSNVARPRQVKPLRMRMYADDEELINKTTRLYEHERQHDSVYSRLGAKFTNDELCQLGQHISPLSRDEPSSINTVKKRSLATGYENDLRNTIKRLKSDKFKHRSPLWRD